MRLGIAPLLGMLATVVCSAAVEDRKTTERAFTMPAGPKKLIVDNIHGGIEVRGHSGNDVKVTVQEHWRADDESQMQEARRDVRLDITQQGNELKLYVDGPFRCNCSNGEGRSRPGYTARFEFVILAPFDTAVDLRTVNGGKILAEKVVGNFAIRHVNGPIELTDLVGSGTAHTVNGGVRATFRESPKDATSFKSVNGELAVTFPPGLSADLLLKTMNGDAFTDFEVTAQPTPAAAGERNGSRFVYRGKDRATTVRAGSGGPPIRFETLNGDIRILKRGQ